MWCMYTVLSFIRLETASSLRPTWVTSARRTGQHLGVNLQLQMTEPNSDTEDISDLLDGPSKNDRKAEIKPNPMDGLWLSPDSSNPGVSA